MFSRISQVALSLAAGLLIAVPTLSQNEGEQVLSEIGVVGSNANGFGVVRPKLTTPLSDPLDPRYSDWVAPAPDTNFRAFTISPTGTALVLDGNFLREYSVKGVERTTEKGFPPFPFDVTALTFLVPKGRNGVQETQLAEVNTFIVLDDRTLRVFGKTKGNSFVVIAVKIDQAVPEARLAADGTPPTIADCDADEFVFGEAERPSSYVCVGDKKNVIKFTVAEQDPFQGEDTGIPFEQDFQVVATLNGKTIDSVTSFPYLDTDGVLVERLIVSLNTGEVFSIDPDSGADSSLGFLPTTDEFCEPGRTDNQKYTVRADAAGEVLFLGNGFCNTVSLFTNDNVNPGGIKSLGVDATGESGPVSNPFDLVNFFVNSLDWQIGQGGDFLDCGAADYDFNNPPAETPEGVCQFGERDGQFVGWRQNVLESVNTEYRMFQFQDLVDCRQTDTCDTSWLSCPEDSDSSQRECALNLTEVLLDAEPSGAFREAAFGEAEPPVMWVPDYVRGEKCIPVDAAYVLADDDFDNCPAPAGTPQLKFNAYKFYSIFAVDDAIFRDTGLLDVKIDKVRPASDFSDDECETLAGPTPIEEMLETTNLQLYNSSDQFGTVDRDARVNNRGSIITNAGCNGFSRTFRFSAYTVGVEFYCGENGQETCETPEALRIYVDQTERMLKELREVKENLVCSTFTNPYVDTQNPYYGGEVEDALELGPILPAADCDDIENELVQLELKFETCVDSLVNPNGGSQENCNAFVTKSNNLFAVLDAAAWRNPEIPEDVAEVGGLVAFKPNYEGELYQRLFTLTFFVENYLTNMGWTPPPLPAE